MSERWGMFAGKKITWTGEEGRFLTENEYNQIISAYEGAIDEREKTEAQNDQIREQNVKMKEANMRLKHELQMRVSGDNDYKPPPLPPKEGGTSLRKLTERGESGIRVRDE